MVELLRGPVGGGVAIGALRALTAAVNVVRQMASNTLFRCALVPLTRVACATRYVAMLVRERKVGLVVVEPHFPP